MANQEHLYLLKQGIDTWNQWRREHLGIQSDLCAADLRGADLRGAYFRGSDLSEADLRGANLTGVHLGEANLRGADLSEAFLNGAYLKGANLSEANLSKARLIGINLEEAKLIRADLRRAYLNGADFKGADLSSAKLMGADLSGAYFNYAKLIEADLSNANLSSAILVGTTLTRASLTGCSIHGISVWNVELEGAKQDSLIITQEKETIITVDNLEVAQFIYLLLNNNKIRDVINIVTSKVVLILGRFMPERKAVLDVLRGELRKQNYMPVMFDFDKPNSRNLTETISILAGLARFVIADLTDAKSIPQELERIVPRLRVPVQPLLHSSEEYPYSLFESFEDYSWVLPLYRYDDIGTLLQSLREQIITPAELKAQKLEKRKQED